MNDLKPVAFLSDSALKELKHPCIVACSPYETAAMRHALYAIPSTHRVVSVEFLKVLLDYIEDCDYARGTEDKLRAIINNK